MTCFQHLSFRYLTKNGNELDSRQSFISSDKNWYFCAYFKPGKITQQFAYLQYKQIYSAHNQWHILGFFSFFFLICGYMFYLFFQTGDFFFYCICRKVKFYLSHQYAKRDLHKKKSCLDSVYHIKVCVIFQKEFELIVFVFLIVKIEKNCT